MKLIDIAKITLLLLGIAVWMVGLKTDDRRLQMGAIAFVVIAFLLRFVKTAKS